jgi:hemolysin activation/secretion protein
VVVSIVHRAVRLLAWTWPALPLLAGAQLSTSTGVPPAPRDPSEQLRRELQERERTPVLRPEVQPEAAKVDDTDAPFPEHLGADGAPLFAISRIVADANAVWFDAGKFRRIASAFEGHELGAAHINVLLDRLTRSLVASGYITSRAVVASQSVAGGQLVIGVQAGRIEQVRYNGRTVPVTGLDSLGLRLALPMRAGDVLRLQDIEQAIDQLNRLRRNQALVQIRPGEQTGGSILEFSNTPGEPRTYTLSVDNQGSADTGRQRVQAGMEQGNALGLMESMSLGLVTSTDTNAVFGALSLPLGYYTLSLMHSWSEYQNLIGDTALVYGRSTSTALAVNRLLSRGQNSKLALDVSLTKRQSTRAINNLSLTPQTQVVARVGLNRLSRFGTPQGMGQWTLDAGLVRGLAALGADQDPPDLPEGAARAQFTKLESTVGLQLPLSPHWAWRSRLAAQWTRSALYSSEQLFAGGVASVRGFAESAAGGDRGLIWRNEWVAHGLLPVLDHGLAKQPLVLEPYLFIDGARLQTIADTPQASLLSVGLGLRFSLGAGSGEIILGKPVRAPASVTHDGSRLNLQIGWQF